VKIFLSFWLAMTLIGTAFTVIHVSSDRSWIHERKVTFISQALHAQGVRSVERIRQDGPRGADALHLELKRRLDVRVFLFRRGDAKAGPWTPSAAVKRLARRATHDGKMIRKPVSGMDLYAVPLEGGNLRGWVIVGEVPHSKSLRRYLDPETLPLRILVVFLISGLICYVLARYISSPIRVLQSAAQKLAEGDLEARVGPTVSGRRDETGELGHDFDRMADRIQTLLDTQRRLLRDISHELRSPLARLNVSLGLARKQAGAEAIGSLDRIEREAERLNELIGELTTLARLEAGSQRIVPEPIDLRVLVEQVVQDANFEGQPRGRRVELGQTQSVVLQGSPELIRRAVENVVRNGVYYTAKDTAVRVDLMRAEGTDGSRARIRVRDHGPGVPEADLDAILRPFFRVADARDRERGGSGIGLAISHRAVSLHHGTLRATNASGGGLVVEIDLPIAPDADDAAKRRRR